MKPKYTYSLNYHFKLISIDRPLFIPPPPPRKPPFLKTLILDFSVVIENRLTDGQTDRHAENRQTDEETDRQADRQTGKQMGRQTGRQTNKRTGDKQTFIHT